MGTEKKHMEDLSCLCRDSFAGYVTTQSCYSTRIYIYIETHMNILHIPCYMHIKLSISVSLSISIYICADTNLHRGIGQGFFSSARASKHMRSLEVQLPSIFKPRGSKSQTERAQGATRRGTRRSWTGGNPGV